jgi:predicted nucleic acid-binding protein
MTGGLRRAAVARYLLDTTVLIDHLTGRRKAVEMVKSLARQGHVLGVCSINVAELYSGLNSQERASADVLITGLDYFEISPEDAKRAGGYRSEFATKGITLTTADTLIAATAVGYGAILVTANVKDYPMEDLALLPQP